MTTETWTAEDIPAYQFDGSGRRPQTDEDAAMSSPVVIVRGMGEKVARDYLIVHLIRNRANAERYGESPLYTAAIELIDKGATFVRIGGRGYRVRDTSICEKHSPYQNCPNCLPANYFVFAQRSFL